MLKSVLASRLRHSIAALFAFTLVVACGGGGGGETPPATTPTASKGTVGVLFTDAPSDEFSAILLNVTEAILIGGENSQEVLFRGSEPIDLLDLTNFSEPVVFGETLAGNYKKLRLVIDNLELVPKDGSPSIFPALPANGRIDLLQPDGFDVLPGRTLLIEIDMDANKSIKITGQGNGRNYNFRPVVKVKIVDGDILPHKLARLEGTVSPNPDNAGGMFELCDIDSPDHCVDIHTDSETSAFDAEGLDTDLLNLAEGDTVVVFGRYETDPDIALNALIVEIGGTAEQVKGNVVSDPADSQFLVVTIDGEDLVVELQGGTRYFDEVGEIGPEAIIVGVDVEVEGVKPPKVDAADPDLMRAALVFLMADPDEQVTGTIAEPIDASARSFDLDLEDMSVLCVRVDEDADVILVDEANSEVSMGTFADLMAGQVVDLFGETAADSCFDANEVIVELMP